MLRDRLTLGNITYDTLKGYDRKKIKIFPDKYHMPDGWQMKGFVYIEPQEAIAAIPTPVLVHLKKQEEGFVRNSAPTRSGRDHIQRSFSKNFIPLLTYLLVRNIELVDNRRNTTKF